MKQIKNFPNYSVTEKGEVYSHKSNKVLKGYVDKQTGYHRVTLLNQGVQATKLVHRLIAEAFILNPESKNTVNHINGIKTDNRAENLEWCTQKENIAHSFKAGLSVISKGKNHYMYGKKGVLHHRSKKVYQFDISGQLIKVWDSLMDIERGTDYSIGHISNCCKGKRNHSNGFLWSYEDKKEGLPKRFCLFCEKELTFNSKARVQKYCSERCRYEFKKVL
jgi:hypothetical protein